MVWSVGRVEGVYHKKAKGLLKMTTDIGFFYRASSTSIATEIIPGDLGAIGGYLTDMGSLIAMDCQTHILTITVTAMGGGRYAVMFEVCREIVTPSWEVKSASAEVLAKTRHVFVAQSEDIQCQEGYPSDLPSLASRITQELKASMAKAGEGGAI